MSNRPKCRARSPMLRTATVAALLALGSMAVVRADPATPLPVPARGNRSLATVILQLPWNPGFQFVGYYVAAEMGFYRDAGIEVDIRHAGPAVDAVGMVLSGQAHYSIASSDLLLYRANGAPVVSLACLFQRLPNILLVRADADIVSAADLAGRRVMKDNTGPSLPIRRILHQAGLSLDRVEIVPHTNDLEDLIQRRVDAYDAYVTDEPWTLEKRGVAYRIIAPDESRLHWYADILFTLEGEIKRNPRRAVAFREASLRGWKYAMQHPDEALDIVARRVVAGADREKLAFEAEAIRALIGKERDAIGRQNGDRWMRMAEELVEIGALPAARLAHLDLRRFVFDAEDVRRENLLSPYRRVILLIFVPALLVSAAGLWRLTRKVLRRNAALRASEARYRRLFDNAPAMIIVGRVLRNAAGAADDCLLLDVNRPVERAAGQSRICLRGRRAREIWPASYLNTDTLEQLDQTVVRDRPSVIEMYSDIFKRHLRLTAYPSEHGCFALIIEDVTAATHLKLLLNLQVRVATDNLAAGSPEEIGILIEDSLKHLQFASVGGLYLRETAGASPELRLAHAWGLSETFRQVVEHIPADSDLARAVFSGRTVTLYPGPQRDALSIGPALNEERLQAGIVCPLMNGSECLGCINLASRTLPAFAPELVEALEMSARQVAERLARMRAEHALRESEAGFRALAENVRAALFIIQSDGRLCYVNESAVRQTGRPRDQLLAGQWDAVLSEEAVRTLERQMASGTGDGRYEVEGTLKVRDGEPILVEFIASDIPWRGDACLLVIARDLSWQRRMEEEVERTALWEREKLGRELHDGVAQDVVAASLLFETAHLGDAAAREQRAAQIKQLFRQSRQRMQQLMRGLESLDAGEENLSDALRSLAERIAGTFGVDCFFDEQAPPPLRDRGINGHLFYIAREATMNAVRHAKARRILIRLTRSAAGGLRLVVENDGVGFDPDAPPKEGMGLRIMRYRAERIGGVLDIESPPGRGVRVIVELPAS